MIGRVYWFHFLSLFVYLFVWILISYKVCKTCFYGKKKCNVFWFLNLSGCSVCVCACMVGSGVQKTTLSIDFYLIASRVSCFSIVYIRLSPEQVLGVLPSSYRSYEIKFFKIGVLFWIKNICEQLQTTVINGWLGTINRKNSLSSDQSK